MDEPVRVAIPTNIEPRLPPEIIDIVLESLGRSPDRATRNSLIPCFLVSSAFCALARKHYFRKLTIKHFAILVPPLPEREYHLIHFLFDNPNVLGFVQELDVLYDATYRPGSKAHNPLPRYGAKDSPINQDAILGQFPWIGPCPLQQNNVLPLYLLLRQCPIHTARFILRNCEDESIWHSVYPAYHVPICSLPSLKRAYFVRMLPRPAACADDRRVPAGLERLELLWVAQSEEELESDVPSTKPGHQPLLSPPSTNPPHFPLHQVIRINRLDWESSTWLEPRRFFTA